MKKSIITLLHIGYWIIFTSLITLVMVLIGASAGKTGNRFHFGEYFMIASLFGFIPGISGFYIFYHVLFPKFLGKKKILQLVAWGLSATVVIAALTELIAYFWVHHAIWNIENCIGIGITLALCIIPSGTLGLVMRGFINWYGDIKVKEDLRQRNYEIELALVKSQIGPHFLFNTLNNIDVLIIKNPALASEYLNKLSDIMRFMLYETKTEKIPLSKELSYIEKYIALQKIRSDNPNYVNYSASGNTEGILIEPMLFIPFIENAFKHSPNKKTENAIMIRLRVEKDKITFECSNLYIPDGHNSPDHGGLGNDLIRRRLQLLYGNRYKLDVNNANNTYHIELTLPKP
jgi:sensor histidine kinase YesM